MGGENLTVAAGVNQGKVRDAFHDDCPRLRAVRQRAHVRKHGHADNGAQRAKRLECERTFILQPKGARCDHRFKEQVVAAYQDRMSIRGLTRTFGVCYKTVIRWVGEKSGEPARLRGHALAG